MLDNVSKVFGQNIKNMIFDFRPKHPKMPKTFFFPVFATKQVAVMNSELLFTATCFKKKKKSVFIWFWNKIKCLFYEILKLK